MKFSFSPIASVFGYLIACVIMCINPGLCDSESEYTSWGVDEYQLFGLTKQELSTKFKSKLFFSRDFERATVFHNGTGRGYQGPIFELSFSDGRVSSVHGIFVGCRQSCERPRFDSKEAALNYAIQGLSSCTGAEEKKRLVQARQALAELKRASIMKNSKH